MKKSNFFTRITGSGSDDQYADDDFYEGGQPAAYDETRSAASERSAWNQSPEEQGELSVDIYQTPDSIVIKAFLAGVQPGAIDIALTREMVTISGTREEEREVQDENFYQRELYWGSFSRTVLLPEEVDVDMAEASEKHGILMLRLPKINKKRQTKLKVRSR